MHVMARSLPALVIASALLAQPAPKGSPALAGDWAGTISVPGLELDIQIALKEGNPWTGTIAIPAQGLKDFTLSDLKAEGPALSFGMAGIPGDPRFQGRLGMDGRITGTFSQHGKNYPFALGRPSVPAPTLPPGLSEAEIRVGQAPWILHGTFTMPGAKGPFPLVVLVHGSGPQDRDESIAACKPFRDLAWGLAQKGIAVLRYDKRTYAYRAESQALKTITVKEETLEDAAQAVALAKALPGVDPKRVFILGHSLGGYLLPRLAKAAPDCAGYISLAGSARPLEDLILEQIKRRGAPSIYMGKIEADIARIKALGPDSSPTEILLNAPASYWLDLKGFDPAQEAATISKPMLFLQGDKDSQVTLVDFELWKKTLGHRPQVKLTRYATLNHLFMTVEGTSTGAEYGKPGQRVAPEVIQDLAAWIAGR